MTKCCVAMHLSFNGLRQGLFPPLRKNPWKTERGVDVKLLNGLEPRHGCLRQQKVILFDLLLDSIDGRVEFVEGHRGWLTF